jgi:hypothetical protein
MRRNKAGSYSITSSARASRVGGYKPERFACLQVEEFENVVFGGAFAASEYAAP